MSEIEEIINHFGAEHQIDKAIEELAECSLELIYLRNGKARREHLKEEIADAVNMLNQVMYIEGIAPAEINKIVLEKEKRTLAIVRGDGNAEEN